MGLSEIWRCHMNNNHEQPQQEELVKCDVCMKEIPASGARSAETSDYVAHFCGLECYEKWREQMEKKTGISPG